MDNDPDDLQIIQKLKALVESFGYTYDDAFIEDVAKKMDEEIRFIALAPDGHAKSNACLYSYVIRDIARKNYEAH